MKSKIIGIVISFFIGITVYAQSSYDNTMQASNIPLKHSSEQPANATINWMSFTDAVKASEKERKKIFIDVYTKWCGWCKRMDASTYEDPAVIEYMNKYYYAVKLDAETRDTIRYREKIFTYMPQNRANLIALELLGGQMSYPTSVYLDEDFNMLTPSAGYQSSDQLLPQLKFFAENIYKTKKWEEYQSELHK